MKDSESRNALCRFFSIKDEPGFSHCGDTTRAGPQYIRVCSWAGVHTCGELCLLPCLDLSDGRR